MVAWLMMSVSMAGTLPKGTQAVFSGLSYGTWSAFESKGNTKSLPQDASVSQVLSHTQYAYGIHDRFDVALVIPISSVSVSTLSGNMFDTTTGLGQIGLTSNIELLQEDTWSLTGIVGLFTGALHAENRGRLTNIGDGSTQARLGLSSALALPVNSGFLTVSGGAQYVAKIPSTLDFDPKYPADDIVYAVNVGGQYKGYAASVFIDGFQRLDGVDYPAPSSVDGIEAFTSLKASQLKVGINDSLSFNNWTISGYVARSILARNNPMDEWIGGVGLGYVIPSSAQ